MDDNEGDFPDDNSSGDQSIKMNSSFMKSSLVSNPSCSSSKKTKVTKRTQRKQKSSSILRQPIPFSTDLNDKEFASQVPLSKNTSMTINFGNLPVSLSIASHSQNVSILPPVHVMSLEDSNMRFSYTSQVTIPSPGSDSGSNSNTNTNSNSFPSDMIRSPIIGESNPCLLPLQQDPVIPSFNRNGDISNPVQLIQPIVIYSSSYHQSNNPSLSQQQQQQQVLVEPTLNSQSLVNLSSSSIPHCTCTKTRCLKLYCDCLKAGSFCTDSCGCTNCLNRSKNRERTVAIKRLRKSNPNAFKKYDQLNQYENSVSCACQKSMCNKKYCSCYQSGKYCTSKCKCIDCNNRSSDPYL